MAACRERRAERARTLDAETPLEEPAREVVAAVRGERGRLGAPVGEADELTPLVVVRPVPVAFRALARDRRRRLDSVADDVQVARVGEHRVDERQTEAVDGKLLDQLPAGALPQLLGEEGAQATGPTSRTHARVERECAATAVGEGTPDVRLRVATDPELPRLVQVRDGEVVGEGRAEDRRARAPAADEEHGPVERRGAVTEHSRAPSAAS